MRVTLYLDCSAIEKSIDFYVEELALFDVAENYGTGYCLLESRLLRGFHLYLADWCNPAGNEYIFSLDVPDCDAEFQRLQSICFSSGGRILPDENGHIGVLEYPGGKVFQMTDPDNNRFTISERYKGDDDAANADE